MFNRRLILTICLVLAVFCSSTGYCADVRVSAWCDRVIDGDTIECVLLLDSGLKREIIRIAEIDTPELNGPERDRAIAAKRFAEDLVLRRWVVLTIRESRSGKWRRGRYRRLIGRVSIDGRDLGSALLRAGLADEYGKK